MGTDLGMGVNGSGGWKGDLLRPSRSFREQFRVFDLYEGEIFTPDLQARLGQALRDEGLSNAGDDFPRQIKRVFENMGLCWMEEGKPLRITPAGKLYLEEPPGRSKVLDQQVWRYQLPNPVNASDATAGIELHPHAYFVEALLACDGEITGQEFVLFISRARTHDDLEKGGENSYAALVDVRSPIGPTSAPTIPHRVHTMRRQSERTGVSSGSQSVFIVAL